MKKEITIAVTLLALAATPVFAQSHDNNRNGRGNSKETQINHDSKNANNVQPQNAVLGIQTKNDNDNQKITPTALPTGTQTITPTVSTTPCEGNEEHENHGKFVSCVAHLHVGGKEVSEAAHERNDDNSLTGTPAPSVSVTPTASPSVSPTPTASVSPTPITSAMGTLQGESSPVNNLGALFQRFISFLEHWI